MGGGGGGGCGRQLEWIGQVHLHATRVFLGVGRPHPGVGLQFEIEMLPLKWEAKTRCMDLATGVKNVG